MALEPPYFTLKLLLEWFLISYFTKGLFLLEFVFSSNDDGRYCLSFAIETRCVL